MNSTTYRNYNSSAYNKFEKNIADDYETPEWLFRYIKQRFDDQWLPYWHVIVGKNFGCHCTHETRRFVYFYLGKQAFMIYKVGY